MFKKERRKKVFLRHELRPRSPTRSNRYAKGECCCSGVSMSAEGMGRIIDGRMIFFEEVREAGRGVRLGHF
jgi:hypothetical protein